MTRGWAWAIAGMAAAVAASGASARADAQRVLSLDQCADQYVLALSAPEDRLFLSPRADDPDSHLAERARGHARVRPTLEAALVAQPDVAVRYWGGDPRLLAALERRGVTVAQIEDATDMDGVRANIVAVAQALGQPQAGQALIARMDRRLAAAAASPREGSALYLTPGGFTAGDRTLVGAVLRAAGLSNAAPSPYFAPMSVERLLLAPPARFVLGFFDAVRADWRGPGRHPSVRRLIASRESVALPGSLLGCPAWFAAQAAQRLTQDGERRP